MRSPAVLLLCAAGIELMALCLWPSVHLLDSSRDFSPLGDMVIQRYPPVGAVLVGLKAAVDWVFPGALWAWENLVAFSLHTLVAGFVPYAVAAWWLSRAGNVRLRWILGPLACFQITLILVPGSMTTDIYNYALYGEMPVRYGANPFVSTPAEFPQSPLHYIIPIYWQGAPSVYGPFWILLSAGVAAAFQSAPLADELVSYRVIANLAHAANTMLVWAIARQIQPEGRRAPSAALAYGWNPYLLLDFSLNGHNDVLMLTGVLAALWLAARRRLVASAFVLALSVATKYTSVLLAPVLFWWGARHRRPAGSPWVRLGASAAWAAVMGLTVAALYAPWVSGLETFGPVLYWVTGPRLLNFWPEPTLIALTAWTSGLVGVPYEELWEPLLAALKAGAKVALVGYIAFESWRARSIQDVLGASARIMLAFVLLVNTWVMPWYYTWPLALAAPLGWESKLVRVCAGFTLTAPILMYQRQYQHTVVADWAGLFLVLPIVLVAAGSALAAVLRVVQPDRPRREPALG